MPIRQAPLCKGHLQNDSYQAMYMYHDNVVDYLEKI